MHQDLKISPLLYPLPVVVLSTYNEDGSVNALTAAWACPIDTDMIGICLSNDHKSNENFHRNKAFGLFLASESTIAEVDYFGLVSGKEDPHKIETVGFHAHPGKNPLVPVIEEFPLCIECVYDHEEPDTGMVYGRILAVHADPKCLVDGRIDLEKAGAICYDPSSHSYRRIGSILAPAYQVGKKFSR